MSIKKSEVEHLFHPVEHAIISKWLQVKPRDIAVNIEPVIDDSLPDGVVGLESDMFGNESEYTLPNAVARIVLSTVQHKLPQWIAFRGNQTIYGRSKFNRHKSKISTLPQLLFEINWATSGPGFPWPEAYYVSYLPDYDVYVVTGSADSPEGSGYTDIAIGHFGADEDLIEGSKRVIRANWQHQVDEWEQQRWEDLWQPGLIPVDGVLEMAADVWAKEVEEEQYAEL